MYLIPHIIQSQLRDSKAAEVYDITYLRGAILESCVAVSAFIVYDGCIFKGSMHTSMEGETSGCSLLGCKVSSFVANANL